MIKGIDKLEIEFINIIFKMDEYNTACSCKYRSSKGCFVLKTEYVAKKVLI
jgi:hypothetical protein